MGTQLKYDTSVNGNCRLVRGANRQSHPNKQGGLNRSEVGKSIKLEARRSAVDVMAGPCEKE